MATRNTSASWGRNCCPTHPDTPLVEDYRAGDTVCPECGLVVGDRVIDVGSEWRTFADDHGSDPSRVGSAENRLLSGDLSTTIVATGDNYDMVRAQNRITGNSQDRQLLHAFSEIRLMAGRLNAPQSIIDRANSLFKKMADTKALRRIVTEANCAACLYIACAQENAVRSFREICAVCNVSKKQISKSFKLIVRALNTNVEAATAADFMSRFCSRLGLPHKAQVIAAHVAKEASELDVLAGRFPVTIAAASIYFTTIVMGIEKSASEIGDVAGVTEHTIKQSFRAMLDAKEKLLPQDFTPVISLDMLYNYR